MTKHDIEPTEGPGTTNDPNQADNQAIDIKDPFADVPEESEGPPQTNPDPSTGPGTTKDPNQADRT